jgi:hypothetical protein
VVNEDYFLGSAAELEQILLKQCSLWQKFRTRWRALTSAHAIPDHAREAQAVSPPEPRAAVAQTPGPAGAT